MSNIGFNDLQEPITLIRPLGDDEWGDPIPGTGTSQVITEALFAPGATRELEVNANTVDADGTLFIDPATATVRPTDRILIRGELYEVAGKPRVFINTVTEIPVRLVTG
ncbi:MAG: hypothetical protein ABWY93_18885 [Mycobacterium sp.]